jgi:uncharacterized small protein (DUF1192 family)
MINPDDLEPPKPLAKLTDLQPMSIGELKIYIESLKTEIARAENAIAAKEKHRSGLDGLFSFSKSED